MGESVSTLKLLRIQRKFILSQVSESKYKDNHFKKYQKTFNSTTTENGDFIWGMKLSGVEETTFPIYPSIDFFTVHVCYILYDLQHNMTDRLRLGASYVVI